MKRGVTSWLFVKIAVMRIMAGSSVKNAELLLILVLRRMPYLLKIFLISHFMMSTGNLRS